MALRGSGSANVFSTINSNAWSLSRRRWLRQAITVAPVTSCAAMPGQQFTDRATPSAAGIRLSLSLTSTSRAAAASL
jgi:hypothetical protein